MAAETNIDGQPQTDDAAIVLLKRVASMLQRMAGDVDSRTIVAGTPYASVDCFGLEAGSDGATISSITAPNHTGSLVGFVLAPGQCLNVYFTAITLDGAGGDCVAYTRQ